MEGYGLQTNKQPPSPPCVQIAHSFLFAVFPSLIMDVYTPVMIFLIQMDSISVVNGSANNGKWLIL